jgi:ribokinase
MGARHGPSGNDPLPWDELADTDGVYFTAGDEGALRAGRRARALVGTSRVLDDLAKAHVRLDAVIGSALDASERYIPGALDPPPRFVVLTRGSEGGTFTVDGGPPRDFPPAPVPGPVVDAYGSGDSFAAGVTYGLAAGMAIEVALDLAARCGAAALTGRGSYEGQLRLTEE